MRNEQGLRVLQAAGCASIARAVIECPIEYAKVARQTGQTWPTPGITWPVPPIIAREQLGTTGPPLLPVT